MFAENVGTIVSNTLAAWEELSRLWSPNDEPPCLFASFVCNAVITCCRQPPEIGRKNLLEVLAARSPSGKGLEEFVLATDVIYNSSNVAARRAAGDMLADLVELKKLLEDGSPLLLPIRQGVSGGRLAATQTGLQETGNNG
eukprot:TRINITY_DN747_c0_g2_i1.p2 TRINITY_DN747_c0_g2~~TRINITY_DN747_c0_g2_i1.p2  ORF type:complete len:141 (+),score=22.65 TRINITY_DN747_c0_g2_i1:196-618(+)